MRAPMGLLGRKLFMYVRSSLNVARSSEGRPRPPSLQISRDELRIRMLALLPRMPEVAVLHMPVVRKSLSSKGLARSLSFKKIIPRSRRQT